MNPYCPRNVPRRRSQCLSTCLRLPSILTLLLVLSSAVQLLVTAEEKPPAVSVESFVSSLDNDGDGEIGTEEANKFLAKLETCTQEQGCAASPEDPDFSTSQVGQDVSMAALMNNHKLNIKFNYGGNSISVSEMTDHLAHMLTGDRVVAWVIHGLRLPQYAEQFEQNSIDGLDFPSLISDNGAALQDDLGITSGLHRNKILAALVRQVFGIGQVPEPPKDLSCWGMQTRIVLQWKPPTNAGIPPFHKFLIKRRRLCLVTGVKGSWKELGDTAEESWVDGANLQEGQEYEYRVQAWSAHGPSEWANTTGCRLLGKSDVASAVTLDQTEQPMPPGNLLAREAPAEGLLLLSETADALPPSGTIIEGHAQRLQAAAASASALGPAEQEQNGDGTVWGFVWSVNGGLLLLGLLSRSSFLFRAFSAVSAYLRHLIALMTPSRSSSNRFFRRVAHLMGALSDAFHAVRLAMLGDVSLPQQEEQLQARPVSQGGWKEQSSRSVSSLSSASANSSTSLDHGMAILPGSHSNSLPSSGHSLDSTTEHPDYRGGRNASSAEGENMENSKGQLDLLQVQKSRSIITGKLGSQEKVGSSKNRCNAQQCSVQFNTLLGFVENLKKHYCRDCQSWYCARHTRIASHSTQHCRFDSQCRCFSCFSRLPAVSQAYLESINRAQPQNTKKEGVSSGKAEASTAVPKSTSEGGLQPLRTIETLAHAPVLEAQVLSPSRAGGLGRRSSSEYILHTAGDSRPSGAATLGELATAQPKEEHLRAMRKCSSSVETRSPSSAKPEQGTPWLKSGMSLLNLGGTRGGESRQSAAEKQATGVSEDEVTRPSPGDEVTLQSSVLTTSTSRSRTPGNSSFERICESSDETSSSGQQHQQVGLITPTLSSQATTPSQGGSTPLMYRCPGSSLKQVPSFGRSRSLRTENTSQLRRDKGLTPSPGDSGGLGSLRHRCNSMEHLQALDAIQQEVDEVTNLEHAGETKSSRKQLTGVKGVFKRSLETFSSILPSGSPKSDDPSKVKRKDVGVKAPLEKARSTFAKFKGVSSGRGSHD